MQLFNHVLGRREQVNLTNLTRGLFESVSRKVLACHIFVIVLEKETEIYIYAKLLSERPFIH